MNTFRICFSPANSNNLISKFCHDCVIIQHQLNIQKKKTTTVCMSLYCFHCFPACISLNRCLTQEIHTTNEWAFYCFLVFPSSHHKSLIGISSREKRIVVTFFSPPHSSLFLFCFWPKMCWKQTEFSLITTSVLRGHLYKKFGTRWSPCKWWMLKKICQTTVKKNTQDNPKLPLVPI